MKDRPFSEWAVPLAGVRQCLEDPALRNAWCQGPLSGLNAFVTTVAGAEAYGHCTSPHLAAACVKRRIEAAPG